MNITLNEDGTITRNEDGKLLATTNADSREIEWKHWTFKKKHEADVIALLLKDDDVEDLVPDDVIEEIVEAVENPEVVTDEPEPERTGRLGDRTPGYPEWVLRTKGQEAYEAQYHKYGKDRYTGESLN